MRWSCTDVKRVLGNLFVGHRTKLDLAVAIVFALAFLVDTKTESFDAVFAADTRASLYNSLATTSGALLGFSLTALAILVALPSTERLDALRAHPHWTRVPQAFFRAAWALLLALMLCTLGIALDDGSTPARAYEVLTVASLGLALVRVVGAIVALDHVMGVARNTAPTRKKIDDPGP